MKNIYKIFIAFAALLAGTSAFAEEGNVPTKMDSLILQKVANPNADGTYTLTLDTYVLGDYTENTTTVKTTKPVDFVLCLDVSGSMSTILKSAVPVASYEKNSTKIKGEDKLIKEFGNADYYKATIGGENNLRDIRWDGKNWQIYNEGFLFIGRGWHNVIGQNWDVKIYKTRMLALIDACDIFLGKIEESQTKSGLKGEKGHKVGVVSFSDSGERVIELTSIDNKTEIANKIHSLSPDGATRADLGMEKAKAMLNAKAEDKSRGKVLVLFTDGKPTKSSSFSSDVANNAIKYANDVKKENATVFSINVYEQQDTQMDTYMNYVSSNYPNAKDMEHGGTRKDTKYYTLATNEDALNSAFETIAEESTSAAGGAAIQIDANKTIIRDVITPSFTIPAVAGDIRNSIRVYEVPVDTTYVPASHDAGDIRFVTLSDDQKKTPAGVNLIPTVPAVTPDGAKGEYMLDVTGFDFSSKWVGFRHASKDGKPAVWTVNPGSKLVIEITIKPDPDAEGGEVTTNDPNSGIYINGEVTKEPDKKYPVPEAVLPKDLVIRTTPLAEGKGETLLFHIMDGNGFDMIVTMTEGEGEIKDGKWSKTVAKLPVKDDGGNDILYRVIPERNWSWAYGEATAKEQKLIENNVFEFTPASATTAKKHAENSANNVFTK